MTTETETKTPRTDAELNRSYATQQGSFNAMVELSYAIESDANDLAQASKAYRQACSNLFEIDPETKLTFAEGSPTKNPEVCRRFLVMREAGAALDKILNGKDGNEPRSATH